MTHPFRRHALSLAAAAVLGLPGLAAHAQVIVQDTLTGASASYHWIALNGACLTAGNNTGSIPACVGLGYYGNHALVGGTSGRLPDAVGQGALRLTNGDFTTGSNGDNQTGAVIGYDTFPTNSGIQVTWTSVTYGGDKLNNTGADGISFFLADGAKSATVGALGGSLGYSCSNVNSTFDGVAGGYVGVGIDEFGNFSNPGDNTDDGPGYHPGRISVRGYGDTNYLDLSASPTYGKYYPTGASSTTQAAAIHNTCKTGYAWNYSGSNQTDGTGHVISTGNKTGDRLAYNYRILRNPDHTLAYVDVPSTAPISNQQAINMPVRGSAKPITYALKITADGILDFSYSYNGGATIPVIAGLNIINTNGPLPGSFRFGFSSGTGGGNNVHEITCFRAAPADESSSSAGSNVQQSARVQTGSQVYLAYYHPTNWWGQLTAQGLVYDKVADTVTVNSTANWDAHCVLTGGACAATGQTTTAQGSSSRAILTYSGGAGVAFQWGNLTSAQQASLTAGDVSQSSDRLDFLRGDRSKEITSSGTFRNRSSVMGAIVDSSPTWVGPPNAPYSALTKDKLHSSATVTDGATYSAFASAKATRTNLVYVGADDGMLHGFRSGSFDSAGTYVSTNNDGHELIAYLPALALDTIHSTTAQLDYSASQYSHNFFVDATPGSGDLYYNGAWHTWIVGGMGPGGQAGGAIGDNTTAGSGAIYALDVTDPTQFSEANAASLVIGEWNASTITCVSTPTACGTHLGMTYGTPAIRRLHDGNWGVIFGNGLNSANGNAGIFIMEINASTGARSFRYLDTGYGINNDPQAAGNRNGIVQVTPADLDGDHITDYVYAGDVFGNVWRFDLTSNVPANWGTSSSPIFSTPAGQPITTRIVVGATPTLASTKSKVMLAFGTGQKLPVTLSNSETYASGTQYLYGIWDWNMSAWNGTTTDTTYDTLTGAHSFTTNDLTAQTFSSVGTGSGNVSGYRTVTSNPVCWVNSAVCSSGNTKYGWKVALPTSTEQVIYNPILAYDMFIVNTTIPSTSQPLNCTTTPAAGYTTAVQMANGGATSQSFFPDASGNFVPFGSSSEMAIGLNATGTPSFVIGGEKVYIVTQTKDGDAVVKQINPTSGTGGRVNWARVR